MADAMQETEAAIELVQDAIQRLNEKNPNHELLLYSVAFPTMHFPNGFSDRFGGEHIPAHFRGTEFTRAAMYKNYYEALCEALN